MSSSGRWGTRTLRSGSWMSLKKRWTWPLSQATFQHALCGASEKADILARQGTRLD